MLAGLQVCDVQCKKYSPYFKDNVKFITHSVEAGISYMAHFSALNLASFNMEQEFSSGFVTHVENNIT